MSKTKNSPLPSDDLNDDSAWPFSDGCDEIVIRVSRYADDGVTPAAFQAIARGRDRTKVWGVGVRVSPTKAVSQAIESFFTPKPGADNQAVVAEEGAIRQRRLNPPEPKVEDPDIEDLLS